MNINKNILLHTGDMLPIMETFYTIQGEGFYSGTPSYFIRIAGCDIGCQWCDVKIVGIQINILQPQLKK